MSRIATIIAARQAPMIGHLGAYANTLTDLIPSLYDGLDIVSREVVGMIPSVSRSASAERAAVGQTVTYHVAPEATLEDIAPSMTIPEPDDKTIGNGTLTITNSKMTNFGIVGEEARGLNNGGPGWQAIQADLFAQGLRTITNQIESDWFAAGVAAASRAVGTAGTTPFSSGVGDSAQLRKVLTDNGAPKDGRSLVVSTTTGAQLLTNTQLTKANESGTIMSLRQGEILDLHGFSIKETGQGVEHTAGTGSGFVTNGALAEGATTITVDTGTGTVLAGDIVSFAGSAHKYVVATALSGGSFTIYGPGLVDAIADGVAMTVGADYDANLGFTKDAFVGALRAPALPPEGDAAIDRMMITDPRSGLSFEVAVYAGFRKVMYMVGAAWGQKAIKPAHMALLLG